jgi:ribosomal protein S18 acetylase RimI-like enzyme
MPQIEVRPCLLTDLNALAAIDHDFQSNYVWQMDMTHDDAQTTIYFREMRLPRPVKVNYPRDVQGILADWDKRGTLLVSVLEGQPVGYIRTTGGLSPTTAWVTDLAVDARVRRKGIASALVLAAQDWAGQQKATRLVLEMQSKNIAAIRMAQKLGYEFCGYNDHYYMNQDIALFFGQFMR